MTANGLDFQLNECFVQHTRLLLKVSDQCFVTKSSLYGLRKEGKNVV